MRYLCVENLHSAALFAVPLRKSARERPYNSTTRTHKKRQRDATKAEKACVYPLPEGTYYEPDEEEESDEEEEKEEDDGDDKMDVDN